MLNTTDKIIKHKWSIPAHAKAKARGEHTIRDEDLPPQVEVQAFSNKVVLPVFWDAVALAEAAEAKSIIADLGRSLHHHALISLETHQTIQERRNSKGIAAKRPDISNDFPLCGSVNCACCDKPMTACWSRSATVKRYPYYNCQPRDGSEYRKSICAEKIDTGLRIFSVR